MGRFQLNNSNRNIYFIGGVSLFLLFIHSGQYFMMPLNEINPFEYFFGGDFNVFNIVYIITGGSCISFFFLILNAFLTFVFDLLLFVFLLAFFVLLFLGRH